MLRLDPSWLVLTCMLVIGTGKLVVSDSAEGMSAAVLSGSVGACLLEIAAAVDDTCSHVASAQYD